MSRQSGSRVRMLAGAFVASLVVAACGGGGGGSFKPSADTASDNTMSSGSDAPSQPSGGGINDKQDVIDATVQILASGSYRDIAEGTMAGDWSGTGFIISPDGLVVTNMHVVEGAGSLEVFINGEDRPKNARILGVSECNDLAVIDLEGDGYPYLDWYEGEVEPSIDVWVAGFPLGDPEYTLTRGSITKAEADGDSSWASIEYSLEHDARQEPGNSGGPLVTEDGRVIGVNYAGGDVGDTGVEHFYSIPTDLAIPVIEVLQTGEDQDSIGVNGEAFYDPDSGLAGIWVSGVRAGSPASDVGLQPGDIITDLANRPVVTDDDFSDVYGGATKAGYCDVLRTQGSDRPMAISVVRFDTGEVLTGEVNNPDKPLEVQQSIATDIAGSGGGSTYEYELITDESDTIEVEVPVEWSSRDSRVWPFFGNEYPRIDASPNLEDFFNTWGTSGVSVIVAPGLDDSNFSSTLEYFANDFYAATDCDYRGSDNYDNGDSEFPVYGIYDVYENCGDVGTWFVVGAFYDAYYDAMIVVAAAAVDDVDLEVIDRAINTVYLP